MLEIHADNVEIRKIKNRGLSRKVVQDLFNYPTDLAGFDSVLFSTDEDQYLLPSQTVGEFGEFGVSASQGASESMRKVIEASMLPGTPTTTEVAQKLSQKSIDLVKIAHDRAQAFYKARNEIRKLHGQLKNINREVISLGNRPGAEAVIQQKHLLAKQIGNRIIQYSKVAKGAEGLARNAAAQANIAQMIAGTVISGQPNAAVVLAKIYTKLGSQSTAMKALRKKNLAKPSGVSGLDSFEMPLFGGTVDTARDFMRTIAAERDQPKWKIYKSAGCDRIWSGKHSGADFEKCVKLRSDAEWAHWVPTMTPEVRTLLDPYVKKYGRDRGIIRFRGDRAKATKAPGLITTFTRSLKKVPGVGAVVKAAEGGVKLVAKVYAKVFIDWPCKLLTSSVGKMAVQIGASAAGTAYGGPAGAAVAAVAANQANDLNKSLCKGLKELGLTEGEFKTSKIGSAIAHTATRIAKNATNPKNLLRDAMAAGTAYVGGGGASGLLGKAGGGEIAKMGLNTAVKDFSGKALSAVGGKAVEQFAQQAGGQVGKIIVEEGKKRLIAAGEKYVAEKAAQLVGKAVGKEGAMIISKAMPIIMKGKLPSVPTTKDIKNYVARELPGAIAKAIPMTSKQRQLLNQAQKMMASGKLPSIPTSIKLPSIPTDIRLPSIPTSMKLPTIVSASRISEQTLLKMLKNPTAKRNLVKTQPALVRKLISEGYWA